MINITICANRPENLQITSIDFYNHIYLNKKFNTNNFKYFELDGTIFNVIYHNNLIEDSYISTAIRRQNETSLQPNTKITLKPYIKPINIINVTTINITDEWKRIDKYYKESKNKIKIMSPWLKENIINIFKDFYIDKHLRYTICFDTNNFIDKIMTIQFDVSGFINFDTQFNFSYEELKTKNQLIIIDDSRLLNLFKEDVNLKKLGIGGLSSEFLTIFRRVFASRLVPHETRKLLGMSIVKGVLLFGLPGCGKTLLARQLGAILNCSSFKVVNGPELLNKYVGESEKNIRELFETAENDPDDDSLHLIVFDEFDALAKQRGSVQTGINDTIVNQLLSKIDGVNAIENVLLIAMTNRRDLIDEALLRPGRFEVQIEVPLPTYEGRKEIINVHLGKKPKTSLSNDIDIDYIAKHTENYTGAELEAIIKNSETIVMKRFIDPTKLTKIQIEQLKTNFIITMNDLIIAMNEIKPMFGKADIISKTTFMFNTNLTEQIINDHIKIIKEKKKLLFITGDPKTGKTSLANYIAIQTNYKYIDVLNNVKFISEPSIIKINMLNNFFLNSEKCSESVLILDDIEQILDFLKLPCESARINTQILHLIIAHINKKINTERLIIIIGSYDRNFDISTLFPSPLKITT